MYFGELFSSYLMQIFSPGVTFHLRCFLILYIFKTGNFKFTHLFYIFILIELNSIILFDMLTILFLCVHVCLGF